MRDVGAAVLACLLLCAAPVQTQDYDANPPPVPQKRSWEWSIEERLAHRFHPAAIRARASAYRAAHPSVEQHDGGLAANQRPDSRRGVSYVIDGTRNPELFLPHENFQTLLTGVVAPEPLRGQQRAYYRAAIIDFGFDDVDFWRDLEAAVAPFLSVSADAFDGSDDMCRARHKALESARAYFGATLFDRFMYTVVAPSKQHASTTNEVDPAAALRRNGAGCSK